MTEQDDEPFEAYLRRRSALTGRPQATDKLEPPADLDDIILSKARQALQQPRRMPLYEAPRWALPVALVATLLLTFSIVLNVSLSGRQPPPPRAQVAESNTRRNAAKAIPSSQDRLEHDAQSWLKRIEELRTAGRIAEADAELRRFRATFPTYNAQKRPN